MVERGETGASLDSAVLDFCRYYDCLKSLLRQSCADTSDVSDELINSFKLPGGADNVSKYKSGEISSLMASDLGFDAAISSDIDTAMLNDDLQFAESDMSYLTRVTRKLGAIAKPVDGYLVIANEGSGKSVSGKSLPTKYIEASEVANYSCHFRETESEEDAAGTVYANWYDKNSGEYHLEKVGSGAPETELQEIFATRDQATTAAQAKLKRTAKTNKTFSFSTAGRPDLFAESPLVLQGFSAKIPKSWIISKVEHTINSVGFQTRVTCHL